MITTEEPPACRSCGEPILGEAVMVQGALSDRVILLHRDKEGLCVEAFAWTLVLACRHGAKDG